MTLEKTEDRIPSHAEVLEVTGAWAMAQLDGLAEHNPAAMVLASAGLEAGAKLVVCALVAGGELQLDLCMIGESKRMRSLLTVRADGSAGKALH